MYFISSFSLLATLFAPTKRKFALRNNSSKKQATNKSRVQYFEEKNGLDCNKEKSFLMKCSLFTLLQFLCVFLSLLSVLIARTHPRNIKEEEAAARGASPGRERRTSPQIPIYRNEIESLGMTK